MSRYICFLSAQSGVCELFRGALLGISRTAADFMITDLPCEIKGNISIERAKLIQSQLEALGRRC